MTDPESLLGDIETLGDKLGQAKTAITSRFIGQERVVNLTLASLLCGGHALLIGLPGLGKTRLVETLSTVMGLDGNRVQFTPDLMPADILGSEILEKAKGGVKEFRFVPGPIFCQLLMADEINRASPRTQSALLQAMQEKKVTVAGEDRPLDEPFHVLATQNPIEQEGTYPLPEAQLDRFLVQIDVPYPDRDTERDILLSTTGVVEEELRQIFTAEELIAAQQLFASGLRAKAHPAVIAGRRPQLLLGQLDEAMGQRVTHGSGQLGNLNSRCIGLHPLAKQAGKPCQLRLQCLNTVEAGKALYEKDRVVFPCHIHILRG